MQSNKDLKSLNIGFSRQIHIAAENENKQKENSCNTHTPLKYFFTGLSFIARILPEKMQ